MAQAGKAASELAPPRRHIIERPRLTRLLDGADTRVVLLVAPAGYGKTTLARQWLADKPHVWYDATTASTDVAALVAGLARAGTELTGVDVERLQRHLERTADPEADVRALAHLVAGHFADWPRDAWLAIDDYQTIMASKAAESLVRAFSDSTAANLMVLSRTRPTWATARRLLYGEVFELGRHDLAMNAEEANDVLAAAKQRSAPGLVALAEGWPAVIGLAALTDDAAAPEDAIGGALHDFFADELFRGLSHVDQIRLSQLAVAPMITAELARALFGDEGVVTLTKAANAGFVTTTSTGFPMHPLLRRFLLSKFRELNDEHQAATTKAAFDFVVNEKAWDDAFSIIETFGLADLTDRLISFGATDMLASGRLATLRRWFESAQKSSASAPAARAIEAEIGFRQGSHAAAEALAADAARELPLSHVLRQRALLRAGQAAYFGERYEQALSYLEESTNAGADRSLQREARWMAFIASVDSERSDALDYLERFQQVSEPTVDDAVRMSNARLLLAIRRGGITEALNSERPTTHLVPRAADPMIRTGFWNVYGSALIASARYKEAIDVAQQERDEGAAHDLPFVRPHADVLEAVGSVGLREFDRATLLLESIFEFADRHDDVFLRLTAMAIRIRLLLGTGALADAVADTYVEPAPPLTSIRVVYGEYVSMRAVALAANGSTEAARGLVRNVLTSSKNAESRVLALLAIAIASHVEGADCESAGSEALAVVRESGHFDSLVTACRGFPALVELAIRVGYEDLVEDVLTRANDLALLPIRGRFATHRRERPLPLSRREEQVLDLVARGRTNDEIAQILFISAVTVKAHLRHVYEKLGVRNRVEAANLVRGRPPLA